MPGSVDEDLTKDLELGFGGVLVADNSGDLAVFHNCVIHVGVQVGGQVLLEVDELPHDGVEHGEGCVGIAALVFHQHFQQNTGFCQVALCGMGACANDVHTNFGACVTAVDAAVLDDTGVDTVTGSCDSGTHTAEAAAYDNQVIGLLNIINGHFIFPPLQQVL